ncbi:MULTISPECIES: glycoside hydrolase family 108 protein [Elizabethkingia]|uniref:glycoside hydrolase family 108 protein n=1 Tax=Elizabethkingia TaxID=308865 RepID=UPI0010C22B07|nr:MULTISPECIES: glycosyl hydrolase 108 family protein [Elizabethkingia]QCO45757.1 peptidoglycan domain protein [Elizabethkingia sp. 2-6]WQM37690.1 glycosyl hydrolase 108 family protein [Elizabethkingia miricola]
MAKAELLLPFILKWEGGLVNHPNDPGGLTNMGVTIATWKSIGYDKTGDGKVDASDLKKLTKSDVLHVLKVGYWNRWKADQINNQTIANTLVDWVWGSGSWGIKIPQRLLGVTQDGVVGNKTIEALNKQDPKVFLDSLYKARYQYLKDIVNKNSKLTVFLKGWNNRMDDLVKYNKIY